MSEEPPQPQDEKRRAHLEKAKRAVLEFARDNGGSCAMSDMHTFSESRFFIAHQQFSMMLEDCVAEGLADVEDLTVTLTEKGRAFVGGDSDHE